MKTWSEVKDKLGLSDEDLAEIDLEKEKLLKKFEEEKLMDQELKRVLAEINEASGIMVEA